MFLPADGDETKLRREETIFRLCEDIPKRALDISQPNETTGRKGP
jgi:hypothetical protein